LRWDWNNYMASRYPHAKLADDGNDFGPDQVIMTPKLGAGELLGRYKYWMSKGLVQNYDSFKSNLVVIRDPNDSTALQFLIPAELISQFFIGKSLLQFKK
jgi:phage tail sheath gpL-like